MGRKSATTRFGMHSYYRNRIVGTRFNQIHIRIKSLIPENANGSFIQ